MVLPRLRSIAASFAICTAALAPALAAQSTAPDSAHIEEVLRSLNRGHGIGQVAVSPDGTRVAWIDGGRRDGEILFASIHDLKSTRRVTAARKPDEHCQESGLAWEPDSHGLAFFSDCASLGQQEDLYLSRLDKGPAQRLTELHGYVHEPAFSPDGTKIAFLYVEGATPQP